MIYEIRKISAYPAVAGRDMVRPDGYEEVSGESRKNHPTFREWGRILLRIFRSRGFIIDHVNHVGWILCLWGFFKPVLNEFGWTKAMTSGAFSLASLMNGLLAIAMGGLTDRYGPRIVMTVCGLLLGSGFILMSQISVSLASRSVHS